jgi:hypothetical protein
MDKPKKKGSKKTKPLEDKIAQKRGLNYYYSIVYIKSFLFASVIFLLIIQHVYHVIQRILVLVVFVLVRMGDADLYVKVV